MKTIHKGSMYPMYFSRVCPYICTGICKVDGEKWCSMYLDTVQCTTFAECAYHQSLSVLG